MLVKNHNYTKNQKNGNSGYTSAHNNIYFKSGCLYVLCHFCLCHYQMALKQLTKSGFRCSKLKAFPGNDTSTVL